MTSTDRVPDVPPSPFRLPVAVALGVIVPPLGLLAWIGLSGAYRAEYWRSTWVRAGLAIVAISIAPLLVVATLASIGLWPDPDPNPIGLGLLLLAGGALGTIVAAFGVLLVARS